MDRLLQEIPELGDKYELLGKIGQGGMGSVYRVRHVLLDEVRVIKTIRTEKAGKLGKELQDRFLREARAAARLRHPNIASLYDFSLLPTGTAYIVMEYIEGVDLRTLLARGDTLAGEEVHALAQQAASALGFLHRQGFVHRDVSPDNIMLARSPDGSPLAKLIDLGLAKRFGGAEHETKTGIVIGKARYMSPEQITSDTSGDGVGPRSDLYSFGVVLYELFTGTPPITGNDQVSLIAGHLHRPPRSFELTDPLNRVSPALRDVLLKTLEKDPDDRYATAEELASALETARRDPAAVRAPSSPTPSSQGRDILVLAASILVMLLALLVVGTDLVPDFGPDANRGSAAATTTNGAGAWTEFGAFHAVIIGNGAYDQLPDLPTAVADARSIATLLEERYGFAVTLLENATRDEIVTAIFSATSRMRERDNLLVYYAGHGAAVGSDYWLPIDAAPGATSNWISTRHEISNRLDASQARHVLVVADAHFTAPTDEALRGEAPAEALDEEDLRELHARKSRLVLASGSDRPSPRAGDVHSPFARLLLDILEPNDEPLTTTELYARMRAAAAAEPTPIEPLPALAPLPLSRDEGGELVFVPISRR